VAETDISPYLNHSGLVTLKLDGGQGPRTAIIKDYQYNVLKSELVHVDFLEVRADEVISASVSLAPTGTPAGVGHGGMLDQLLYEVEIRGAANRMPESLEVDVSAMEIGDTISLTDIELPGDFEFVDDPDRIAFSVHVARIEEQEPEEGETEVGIVGEEGAGGEQEGEETES
jgi:large subunit ribosomal protein L25